MGMKCDWRVRLISTACLKHLSLISGSLLLNWQSIEYLFMRVWLVGKGQAIVIPGRSYSGKSTLVAELVRAGATYYSDEYAVLDSRGRVHPFSKPLELREEGEFRQTKITVAELGGHSGTKPLPVGLVLMTQFKNGARWRPRKLTAGKGVLEMLFNTVSARRNPRAGAGHSATRRRAS